MKREWIWILLLLVVLSEMIASCSTNNSPGGPAPVPTATPCSGLFGNNSPTGTIAGGMLRLSPFSNLATPIILNQLAVSIVSGGTRYEFGIYAGTTSSPSTLLFDTGAVSITGTGWNKMSLNSPFSINAYTTYWLGIYTDAVFGYTMGDPTGYHAIQSWSTFGSLPVTFTGGAVWHEQMVCFTPPCPPGISIPMPTPGDLYCIWGTTCP